MKKVLTKQYDELVRTTVRLPRSVYKRAKQLSIEHGESLQQIVSDAVQQYEKSRAKATAEEILKYTIRLKPGQKIPTRRELYEEILDHRVRSHR